MLRSCGDGASLLTKENKPTLLGILLQPKHLYEGDYWPEAESIDDLLSFHHKSLLSKSSDQGQLPDSSLPN